MWCEGVLLVGVCSIFSLTFKDEHWLLLEWRDRFVVDTRCFVSVAFVLEAAVFSHKCWPKALGHYIKVSF